MSSTERVMKATPEQVWEVLSDGWLYPLWVVGASRIRDVDETWPEVGSQLYHSVGVWPALIDDSTQVEECRPLRMIKLRARAWPTGEARVVIRLEQVGAETRVVIEENAVNGPAVLMPKVLQDPLLAWRNVEALRRLAYLVERREQ